MFAAGSRIAIRSSPSWTRSLQSGIRASPEAHAEQDQLVYLLDTNILSALIKARRNEALFARLRQHPAENLFTSCICVMELRHGAMRHREAGPLWRRIETEILPRVQILDLQMEEALLAGDIIAALRGQGRMIDVEDVLIGATALSRGLTVVTNNSAHFRRIPSLRSEDWIS